MLQNTTSSLRYVQYVAPLPVIIKTWITIFFFFFFISSPFTFEYEDVVSEYSDLNPIFREVISDFPDILNYTHPFFFREEAVICRVWSVTDGY